MTVTERGNRRGVRETDQPGFVDHPDRLDDALKYRRREALPGQRRRLADAIGRSSSLSDPQAGKLLNPGSDSTTARLSQPHMREHLPQFCANALARTPGQPPVPEPARAPSTTLNTIRLAPGTSAEITFDQAPAALRAS
jgi:hypothetical protein